MLTTTTATENAIAFLKGFDNTANAIAFLAEYREEYGMDDAEEGQALLDWLGDEMAEEAPAWASDAVREMAREVDATEVTEYLDGLDD